MTASDRTSQQIWEAYHLKEYTLNSSITNMFHVVIIGFSGLPDHPGPMYNDLSFHTLDELHLEEGLAIEDLVKATESNRQYTTEGVYDVIEFCNDTYPELRGELDEQIKKFFRFTRGLEYGYSFGSPQDEIVSFAIFLRGDLRSLQKLVASGN